MQEALGWTFNGCALGCLVGIVLFIIALIVIPAFTFGPGRGFVIVFGTALIGAVIAFILRRNQLFRRK